MTNLELLNKIPGIHSSDIRLKFSRWCVERAMMHAESVLKLIPKNENRPADCCALVRKWTNGEAVSFSQLTNASANAAAYAADANDSAAYAAAYAAHAAYAANDANDANASANTAYAASTAAASANAAASTATYAAAYAAEKQQQEYWLQANMREALIAWGDDVLGPSMGLLYMCEDASGNTLLLEIGNAACD
jgi:cell wall-associated NlpC family hydrolase